MANHHLLALAPRHRQRDTIKANALVKISIGREPHRGSRTCHARPHGQQIIPAAGQAMDVVRQVNLPGQRGSQRYQEACVSHIAPGYPGQVTEDDDQRKTAADGGYALAGQNRADLRPQRIT